MDFAVINAVPFILAILVALPIGRESLSKTERALLIAIALLVTFTALLAYFPQVQAADTAFKEAKALVEDSEPTSESVEEAETDVAASQGFQEIIRDETTTEPTEALDTPNADSELESVNANAPPKTNALVRTIEWVPAIGLNLVFYLDGLSLMFALIVTGVGAGIIFYAGYYFEEDEDFTRFTAILLVFAGAMLGLVLSGNLITLFIMWEMTSITSFLLIGFKGYKIEDARFGAMQAFAITGVGALALIAGFVLLAFITGDVTNSGGFIFDLTVILQADPAAIGAHPLYMGALILIALGAFTKSAQMPFHFWLPGAMEAPTPASAYLHSATMVKAGVYLLLRLYPPMHYNEMWTTLLLVVGLGTMFLGALFAFGQRDLKGVLAYLTVSWLGALVSLIALPEYAGIKAALLGVMAHAFYKAALFLSAGTIDHNTGTRIMDNLGGLRKQMPVIAGVFTVSVLSMGGVPLFFGFVAKETLLAGYADGGFGGTAYTIVAVAAAIMFAAGLMMVWEVFFKEPDHEIHFHASPKLMDLTPVVLMICTITFGFLIDPPITFVKDLVTTAVPKEFSLYLIPPAGLADPYFQTSLLAIAGGVVLFFMRGILVRIMTSLPLVRATTVYRGVVGLVDWFGDQAVRTQNGQVRYYLLVVMGTVAAVMLGTVLTTFEATPVSFSIANINAADILRVILLIVSVIAALFTVVIREHIYAVLSLGVLGYAIGAIFLLEPAPDVSLVQFLVETIATVLVIIMLGRISSKHRQEAMDNLWKGNTLIGKYNVGIIRDLVIASAVGLTVFLFAFTALANRGERDSIAQYHLDNAYTEFGVTDVVGAVVADYRAMDTLIEIVVFAASALGVLTLLTRGVDINPMSPSPEGLKMQDEFDDESLEQVQDATNLNTPFTRFVSLLLLPLAFLVALSHIINGSSAPGDGFTAGAILGLITALYYVVFGYEAVRERFAGFSPDRLMRGGMILAFVNALFPLVFGLGDGAFLGYVNYGELLGIGSFLDSFGLKFTTTVVFEIGICLTVFGATGLIMEAIAHPKETRDMTADNDAH